MRKFLNKKQKIALFKSIRLKNNKSDINRIINLFKTESYLNDDISEKYTNVMNDYCIKNKINMKFEVIQKFNSIPEYIKFNNYMVDHIMHFDFYLIFNNQKHKCFSYHINREYGFKPNRRNIFFDDGNSFLEQYLNRRVFIELPKDINFFKKYITKAYRIFYNKIINENFKTNYDLLDIINKKNINYYALVIDRKNNKFLNMEKIIN